MADGFDTPPTEDERVDPWAAPPTDAEAVSAAPAQAAPPPSKPAFDATGTAALHLARHGLLGLGDKAIAGIQALRDAFGDKTGKNTIAGAYNRNLALLDQMAEEGDKQNPWMARAGNVLGVGASIPLIAAGGALSGLGKVAQAGSLGDKAVAGAKLGSALGALGGIGQGRGLGSDLLNGVVGAGAGAATGAAAPWLAENVLSPAADKLRSLAGSLKINSIHPTPAVGRAMEQLPGGRSGVGQELLERGVGGLTKAGTAAQATAERQAAGKAIGQVVSAYEKAGGKPIDINAPLADGLNYAAKLQAEPTTEKAGQQLEELIYKYATKYQGKPVPATEALALKRALGDAAYKHGVASEVGDTVAGDYGEGMAKLERGIDDALDKAVGPGFGKANLSSQRLYRAAAAAENTASRGATNNIVGLLPHIAGGGVFAGTHSAPGAMATTAASMLAQKYGAQAAARAAFGFGNALSGAALPAAESAAAPLAESASGKAAAMIAALRAKGVPVIDIPTPMISQREK